MKYNKGNSSHLTLNTDMSSEVCQQFLQELFPADKGFEHNVSRDLGNGETVHCDVIGNEIVVADWRYLWQHGRSLSGWTVKPIVLSSNRRDLSEARSFIRMQLSRMDLDKIAETAQATYAGPYGMLHNADRSKAKNKAARDARNEQKSLVEKHSLFDLSRREVLRPILDESGYRLTFDVLRRLGTGFINVDIVATSRTNESIKYYVISHAPSDSERALLDESQSRQAQIIECLLGPNEKMFQYSMRLIPALAEGKTRLTNVPEWLT